MNAQQIAAPVAAVKISSHGLGTRINSTNQLASPTVHQQSQNLLLSDGPQRSPERPQVIVDERGAFPSKLTSQLTMLSTKQQISPKVNPINTATNFMPGTKTSTNKYLSVLKKNQAQKKVIVQKKNRDLPGSSQIKRSHAATAEELRNQRLKMRKYVQVTKNISNTGYQTMLSMNGAETLGEQDRYMIDEYLGISGQESSEQSSPQKKVLVGTKSNLHQLKEEQREIEAKLKFIDSLINQSNQPTTVTKFLGGGILKRQRTEDFVVSLDQYQRAMNDLQKTMENIKTIEQPAKDRFQNQVTEGLRSAKYSEMSMIDNQRYCQNIEELLSRQGQSRQVLSVIPTVSGTNPSQEENDKLSQSNPSTNRIYEATYLRRSFDTNRIMRDSIKSSSFVLNTKLEGVNSQVEPQIMSGKRPSDHPSREIKSPKTNQTLLKSNRDELEINTAGTPDPGNTSCKLKVITEVVIQGNNPNEKHEEGSNDGSSSEDDEEIKQKFLRAAQESAQSGMAKVDLVFNPEGADELKEFSRQQLYDSKAFHARTSINNPLYKTVTSGKQKLMECMEIQEGSSRDNLLQQLKSGNAVNLLPITQGKQFKSMIQQNNNDDIGLKDDQKPKKSKGSKVEGAESACEKFDQKRLTEIGKLAQHFRPQSLSKLEVLDTSVIYQQDGDMSRGVLYFSNLESLKSFLFNKKRPIFSKQGNKIHYQTTTQQQQNSNQKRRNTFDEEQEKNKALAADILKKRQYLHKTITNLMPQVKLKSLSQQRRPDFQQTMDYVQSRIMNLPTNANTITGGDTTTQWAPITSQQQTFYNPIRKSNYLFDDIMNADGIIDLRIMNNPAGGAVTSPKFSSTAYASGFGHRGLSRQQDNSNGVHSSHPFNKRSESSPSNSRNSRYLVKRQYGFNSNMDHQISGATAKPPKPNIKEGKSRNTLQQDNSDATLSDSQCTNSSQVQTRQVVFFKTSNSNKQETGSYIVQYPQLRPTLNIDDPKNVTATQFKSNALTVGSHQHFLKNATDPSPLTKKRLQFETTQIKMNNEIERSKMRDMNEQGEARKGSSSPVGPDQDQISTQPGTRKHVIFSTYDGVVKPGGVFQKKAQETKGKESSMIPPIHPQKYQMASTTAYFHERKRSQLGKQVRVSGGSFFGTQQDSRDQASRLGTGSFTNSHKSQSINDPIAKQERPSLEGSYNNTRRVSGDRSQVHTSSQQNVMNGGSLRGLMRYDNSSGLQKGQAARMMGQNIAQSKFTVVQD